MHETCTACMERDIFYETKQAHMHNHLYANDPESNKSLKCSEAHFYNYNSPEL